MAQGLIRAATSDNVQPLVLMVAERFSTTLPMGLKTRLKIERLAIQRQSTVLSFVKVQVGYSKGDSADYLSKSDGGVRFLSFTAALCSIDNKSLLRDF
jgi:hypothetical protein